MDVGVVMAFQSSHNQPLSDFEIYQKEIEVAKLAEPLGYDSIWAVEHHFTNYTMCPNPIEFLTYMSAITSKIKLGTAAMILPWHKDPLRVATDLSMLDNLSGGRVIVGLGRGLGRVEYDGFGVDMSASRDMFNESAPMILNALETGVMEEHHGEYFDQIKVDVRPAPFKSFKDRTYIVSTSPETIPHAVGLGATLMTFAVGPWKQRAKDIIAYREQYQNVHNRVAPPTSANIFTYCDKDPGKAKDMAYKYMGDYWESAMTHYEMKGEHFDTIKGYEHYGRSAVAMRENSDRVTEQYVEQQIYGTPDECLQRLRAIEDIVGPIELNCFSTYAGMDYEDVKKSMTLFAEQALPALKKWEYKDNAA
ncbi:MAG: LLM class flavin-dependent oxidoreductase [Porticoccaceae bacterium]|nr:LLM class flavin-dependent oxidoreductase [Porticoccaceae bacterium]